MSTSARRLFSLGALLFCSAIPQKSMADNLTFRVQSMAQQRAQVVFFSQDRNVRWPGPGRAYTLSDYDTHSFKLNCLTREKICYGAWTSPNQQFTWGTGPGGRGSCSGCCYTCEGGDSTNTIVLRNPVRR
jgi:hypothetical protein